MNKNNILAVIAISMAQLARVSAQDDAYFDSSAFNSEATNFSKIETIKTWVADIHHTDAQLMRKLQANVAMTVPQNPYSLRFMLPVKNNPGDNRYFGKSFRTLEAAELPFLQFAKQASLNKPVITLEIAASIGLVSFKVPFAFSNEGTHYANDISQEMLNNAFQQFIDNRLQGTQLKKHLKTLPGDCFHILEQEPNLRNKVTAIYVQNLEHFFNPHQHQLFLTLLENLLEENGQAFLCAHSFSFGTDSNHPLFKLWSSQKSINDIYPGFAKYEVEFTAIENSQATLPETLISNVYRPDDDTTIEKEYVGNPQYIESRYINPMGLVKLSKIKQRVVSNAFSPRIYRNAIALHPNLEVIDTFFMNGNVGNRLEKWSENVTHAVAIIKKKTRSSTEE